MSLQSVLSSSELSVHPSSCCRFCGKNVKSSGNKIPRVSLFNVVTNKDLVGFSGKESLVLADIASSFGYELKKEEHLSDISCLTCARNLARSAAIIAKLFSGENPKVSGKRPSDCRSPTGETPGAKRGSGQGSDKSTGNSRRSLGLGESSACSPSSDDDLGVSPITDEIASGMNITADQTVVKVFVGYPTSEKVVEYQCTSPTEKTLVKNIAFHNLKTVGKAVWKHEELREHVFREVLVEMKNEIKSYAKDRECMLKVSTPSVVTSFTNSAFFSQLLQKCPTLSLFLVNAAKTGKVLDSIHAEELLDLSARARNAICLAAASCLKQYNQLLSAAHYRTSLLLMNGGTKSITLERCAHLGITMSHSATVLMQTKAGETSPKCALWRQDTLEKEMKIKFLEEVIVSSSEPMSFDISKDKVCSFKYYNEELYDDLMVFITGVKEKRGEVPAAICRRDVEEALKDLKNSVLHYKLVTDNIDLAVQARHQSSSHTNKSLHWTHTFAVKNRVQIDGSLERHVPQKNIEDLEMAEILPGTEVQERLKESLVPLVLRVITKYCPAYKEFSVAVEHHLHHQYSAAMARKSEQSLLGLEFLNSNKSGDMADILKSFHDQYVPIKDGEVLYKTVMHGDQLTEERARNVQWTYKNGETSAERLEGLEPTFSEFHLKMCLFEVGKKIFVKEESAGERGTSFAEMNRTGSSNAKKGPSVDYNAFKDFFNSETTGHILAAWLDFTGMESLEDNPCTRPLPNLRNRTAKQLQDWIYDEIRQFLAKYVFLHKTDLTEFIDAVEDLSVLQRTGYPCRECGMKFKFHSTRVNHERTQHGHVSSGDGIAEQDEFGYYLCRHRCGKTYKTKQGRNRHEREKHPNSDMPAADPFVSEEPETEDKEDHKHNYHCARMAYGLLITHLDDSVKEGDAGRLLDFLKFALLLLHCHHRVKYAYVVLLFLAKIYAILPKGIALEVLLNRFFNNLGKAGGNIPLDLRMEHLNKLLKIALKQLGSNVSEKGAQRIAKSLQAIEEIIVNVDKDCSRKSRLGYHSDKCLDETIITITKDLHEEQVFTIQPGRHYSFFKKFDMNLLHKLDYREFFTWGSHLFKAWQTMYFN